MESCSPASIKQGMSWGQIMSEDESTSKEGSSSSFHNLMSSDCHMMQECTMCGDVGLSQYLFKCLTCSHRYQHIYCSKVYPQRMEAGICNWCLPMGLEIITEIDNINNNISSNIENSFIDIIKPEYIVEENSNSPVDHQPTQQIKKHSKAFEYLLQIAERDDPSLQLNNPGRSNEENNQKIHNVHTKSAVGHDKMTEICSFHKVGHDHMKKKVDDQDVGTAHFLQQQIVSGCSNDGDRSFYMIRSGGNKDSIRATATATKRLRQNPIQLQADASHDQTIRKFKDHNLSCDQILQKIFTDQNSDHDQEPAMLQSHGIIGFSEDDQERSFPLAGAATPKRARHRQLQAARGDHLGTALDHQRNHNPQASKLGCSEDADQQGKCGFSWRAADSLGAANRVRHRQSVQVAGDDTLNTAAGDQQRSLYNKLQCSPADHRRQQSLQAMNLRCNEDDQLGRSGFSWRPGGDNMGAAKRLRHRQSVHVAGDQDDQNDQNTAASDDQQRGLSKQSSPLMQQHGWSRSISSSPVGKRDHQGPHLIISSPSRAIARRYKLLADVLC